MIDKHGPETAFELRNQCGYSGKLYNLPYSPGAPLKPAFCVSCCPLSSKTSIPNLFICGAGAIRGGGVSGIPGHNAAAAVLEVINS